jgi:hypothetical protein
VRSHYEITSVRWKAFSTWRGELRQAGIIVGVAGPPRSIAPYHAVNIYEMA